MAVLIGGMFRRSLHHLPTTGLGAGQQSCRWWWG